MPPFNTPHRTDQQSPPPPSPCTSTFVDSPESIPVPSTHRTPTSPSSAFSRFTHSVFRSLISPFRRFFPQRASFASGDDAGRRNCPDQLDATDSWDPSVSSTTLNYSFSSSSSSSSSFSLTPEKGKETQDALKRTEQAFTRFEYDPRTFRERLLVSAKVKNQLDKSRLLYVPFRRVYKYALLFTLLILTLFLTPSLIPHWLGFEWASPSDLCQSPDEKLHVLNATIWGMAGVAAWRAHVAEQRALLGCMNSSAGAFYRRPKRFQWRDECTPERAQRSLHSKECREVKTNVCNSIGGFFGFVASLSGKCVKETGPPICVNTTDVGRADSLLRLRLERDRAAAARKRYAGLLNESDAANLARGNDSLQTATEVQAAAASDRIHDIAARLRTQVDVAADAFIVYSLIAIAVGVPLVVYRREKGSMVQSAAFGLTKASFVVVFVLVLTLFDTVSVLLRRSDFSALFRNFLHDPCYVDPRFSAKRVKLISDACADIREQEEQTSRLLDQIDSVYYDTRLFGFCKDERRPLETHPALPVFDELRHAYRHNNTHTLSHLRFINISSPRPPLCNSTALNDATRNAPRNRNGVWYTLLRSGVLAQLLLKFVLTGWVVQVCAYFQPMVLHNGKVEIWGPVDKDLQHHNGKPRLPDREENAIRRFARDKHLLPLVLFSALLVAETALVVYSAAVALADDNENGNAATHGKPQHLMEPLAANSSVKFECPAALFATTET